MIRFELLDVAYGWKVSGIPDEVAVEVSGDEASEEVWGSVTDFVEIYGRVREERPGQVDVGSTAFADIETNEVRIHAAEFGVTTTLAEVRAPLRRLVGGIFEAKNQYGDGQHRDTALETMEETLADRGVDIDVRELYDSLTGE